MTWYDDIPDTPEYLGGSSEEERWPADGLDRLIAETAREYNAPPPTVPRDAMWEAIMAARGPQAAPQPAPAPVAPEATPVISLADRRAERAARTRGLVAVAAAAAIFLATGIGIGRWWGPGEPVAGTKGGAAQVASSSPTAPTPAPVATPGDSTTPADTAAPESPDTPRSTQLAATSRRSAGRTGSDRGTLRGPATDAYDVVVLRHFAQAEALLVSYRADSVDAAMDARLAAWARPLLGDTRLLLDSPAARDPRRRRLLEDLELVLAELTRLAPTGAVAATDSASAPSSLQRTERQIIDGTLRRGQLLPRLRTLVPAGT
jgi:hypothetical protein